MSMAGGGRTRKRKPGQGRRVTLDVQADERQHLVEACAFFRADHFRAAEPGSFREQDLKDAAAEIDAVLKRGMRKGRKP